MPDEGRCAAPADLFGNLNVYDLMSKDLFFILKKNVFYAYVDTESTTAFELIYVKYFF